MKIAVQLQQDRCMNSSEDNKRLGFLGIFQEVTGLVSMAHDPQEVMDLVVQRLPGLMEVDAATIRLLDEGTNSFVLGAAFGVSEEYLSRPTIDSKEVMDELRHGQPIVRTDFNMPDSYEDYEFVRREGVLCTMSLPILYEEKVIGLLRLLVKDVREFSDPEIAFAMSLAEQVGIAIIKTRMYRELQTQVEFLEELRRISQLVNSTLELESILSAMVENLPSIMKVKACTIRLLDPATNRLELVAASGLSEKYLSRGSIKKEESIFKVLQGEPVVIYDATRDERVVFHEESLSEGIKSILAVPIRNESEVIGVLRLLTAQHHLFTAGEIRFAESVAEEGGNSIAKARLYRKITLLFNQIEENERFLTTIMDSLWMQILVLSPDKRVVMANRMFLEANEMVENDVLGRTYCQVSPWSGEPEKAGSLLDQVITGGAPVAVLEEQADPHGKRWYERHLSPIQDNDGNTEFVIEAVRDITDQRLLEKEKMERMKLQGVIEMAGTAAHELNSPLFAALGTAELLKDDLADEQLLEDMELIIRNLKTMAELTRKMTSVTGFTTENYVGETNIVNLQLGEE